jgi:hypothetical protein
MFESSKREESSSAPVGADRVKGIINRRRVFAGVAPAVSADPDRGRDLETVFQFPCKALGGMSVAGNPDGR